MAAPIDVHGELAPFELLGGARQTVTNNGTGVNVSDYKGVLKCALSYGAGGGTSPTLDVTIEDSADDASYAALSPAKAFAQVTNAAAAFESISVDTRAVRKFIRAVATLTGTSPTFDGSVTVVGQKQYT